MSFLSMLRYCIKLIFSTDEANRKLYRENCFSKEFLLDALQGVGFQSVEILAPTEGNAIISIRAKLYDERGNSLIITVSHIGNMISFSACPKAIDERVPKNANCISVTYTYFPKYIVTSEKKDGLVFGNQSQVNLFRECKSKANLLFEDLEDELNRSKGSFKI